MCKIFFKNKKKLPSKILTEIKKEKKSNLKQRKNLEIIKSVIGISKIRVEGINAGNDGYYFEFRVK